MPGVPWAEVESLFFFLLSHFPFGAARPPLPGAPRAETHGRQAPGLRVPPCPPPSKQNLVAPPPFRDPLSPRKDGTRRHGRAAGAAPTVLGLHQAAGGRPVEKRPVPGG